MKYHERPMVTELLNQILRTERDGLLRFIMSRRVPEDDADDVLQRTLERVLNLDIQGNIADILQELTEDQFTEDQLNRLRDSLKALTVYWLKLYCKEYISDQNRRPLPEPGDSTVFARCQSPMMQVLRELIIELTPPTEVDVDAVIDWLMNADSDKEPADSNVLTFVEHVAKLAGCKSTEEEFMRKRVSLPSVPDKDLFPEMSKASISRGKKSAFLKVCNLFDVKARSYTQERGRKPKSRKLKRVK